MGKADKIVFKIARIFGGFLYVFVFTLFVLTSFLAGYAKGYVYGWNGAVVKLQKEVPAKTSAAVAATPTPRPAAPAPKPSWGGPELWDVVNKRRVEFGVNPLKQKDELCTIASIRLNQLLELGGLDGHEGFGKLVETRPDLKWIFDKYDISEFLVSGATSPQDAVSLWENTLGHKKLLSGGEYVWGCIYAQNGFGVAIAAY